MAPGCWRRMELVVDVVVGPVWTCLFETHNPTHTQHEHHDNNNNNNQRASVRFCALLLPFSFSSRPFFMTWHYEHHCCCHDDITVIEGPPSKNSVFCSFLVAGFPCFCFRCFLFVHSPVCVWWQQQLLVSVCTLCLTSLFFCCVVLPCCCCCWALSFFSFSAVVVVFFIVAVVFRGRIPSCPQRTSLHEASDKAILSDSPSSVPIQQTVPSGCCSSSHNKDGLCRQPNSLGRGQRIEQRKGQR